MEKNNSFREIQELCKQMKHGNEVYINNSEIGMNNTFKRLDPNEVISPTITGLRLSHTFKVKELIEVIKNQFADKSRKLFEDEGLELEVLRLDARGWKKGKVRISLEFCPDEPEIEETLENNQSEINQTESPLDDIRQIMHGNS